MSPTRPLLIALLTLAPIAPGARAAEPAELWATHCRGCHGEAGRGDTGLGRRLKLADLSSSDWKKGEGAQPARLRAVIADGVAGSRMKGYSEKLSAAELDALVAYVRAL